MVEDVMLLSCLYLDFMLFFSPCYKIQQGSGQAVWENGCLLSWLVNFPEATGYPQLEIACYVGQTDLSQRDSYGPGQLFCLSQDSDLRGKSMTQPQFCSFMPLIKAIVLCFPTLFKENIPWSKCQTDEDGEIPCHTRLYKLGLWRKDLMPIV